MPRDVVISVENLSKSYLIGHDRQRERYHSLRDTLVRQGKNYVRKALDMARGRQIVQGDSVEEFWALKDVSFEVKRGDVLGIIGRNGAGKSTLLKVLSRITEPTLGRVTLEGRVASLLEVGTGFHPELTGRENIFLNGAILGMTKLEIKKKFDEIVAFAEVERFLDTPVKRYSSGMYVRLAFAVAAHLEPEILVVDEVLAVGDAKFQEKCLGKLQECSNDGRTILFVSHNLHALRSLCCTSLLLQGGTVLARGGLSTVIETYLDSGTNENLNWTFATVKRQPTQLEVCSARLLAENSREYGIDLSTSLTLEILVQVHQGGDYLMDIILYNLDNSVVFNSCSKPNDMKPGSYAFTCEIPGGLLNDGYHSITIAGVLNHTLVVCKHEKIINFCVVEKEREIKWTGKWPGAVRPKLQWTIEKKE
jgi:lipopolysaccharide transport system ATP-binding protein